MAVTWCVLLVLGLIKAKSQQMKLSYKHHPGDDSSPSTPISSSVSDEKNGDGIGDAEKDIHDFEEHEWNHKIVFSCQKRLSCLSHTLQLVIRTSDTICSR